MTTALAERTELGLTVTPDQLDLVSRTIAAGATEAELKLYLYDCARQRVHPLDRLLHFTKRGGKYTPVTSIDLMRIRAAETGEYAGSDDAVFEQISRRPASHLDIEAATVTVWRLVQGTRCSSPRPRAGRNTTPAIRAGTCGERCRTRCWRNAPKPSPCGKASRASWRASTRKRKWIKPTARGGMSSNLQRHQECARTPRARRRETCGHHFHSCPTHPGR
jgi:hypothetical protein